MDLSRLTQIRSAKTRSISPENHTGAPGAGGMCPLGEGSARHAARELGLGWKVNPFMVLKPGEVLTIADIDGSGVITWAIVNHPFGGLGVPVTRSGTVQLQACADALDQWPVQSIVFLLALFFAAFMGFKTGYRP